MKWIEKRIREKQLFLLDIDGTVSLDAEWIEGAVPFFEKVEKIGGKCVFITNNSTKSIAAYVKKFEQMGRKVQADNFLTASYVTADYLKEKYGAKKLFVAGTRSFCEELKAFGLNITGEVQPDVSAVVVGFDNELTYEKIEKACRLLQTQSVDFVATNPDLACPVSYGFVPDCGAICQMISQAVKREPVFIGKPNPRMVQLAMAQNGVSASRTVVLGDRLYTDIACGRNAGVETVVVFTGEAKREDLDHTEYVPTWYCDSIKDVYLAMGGME